jgi:hypothetical protein
MSIHLADVGLPVHPTKRHPLTGKPLQALGFTKRGAAIWPVMGGSQPTGEPHPNPVPGPPPGAPHPGPNPNPGPPQQSQIVPAPPGQFPQTPPPQTPGTGNGADGYPENTPVQQMNAEQQAAYWRHYARRNEDRLKQMGDYAQLKEQAEAYQKYLLDSQTEQQKAIAEAEQRGRKTALAEAGGHMVEAYVRASAAGRMSEEQVSTLLQGLDRNRFVNPATGQVDAQMVQGYISMLAPAPMVPGYPGGVMPPGVLYPPANTTVGMPPGAVTVPGQQPQMTYPPAQPQQQQPGPWGYPAQPAPGQPPAQPDMGAQRQVPSYGQAAYPIPQPRGLEAGKAIAQARFGSKKPA